MKTEYTYDSRRGNNPRFKQSYVDYVNLLTPKIWEKPEVKLSHSICELLAHKEAFLIIKDIRETRSKIHNLETRMLYLQQRSIKGIIHREETAELSKITGTIRRYDEWIKDLNSFKDQLLRVYPYKK